MRTTYIPGVKGNKIHKENTKHLNRKRVESHKHMAKVSSALLKR